MRRKRNADDAVTQAKRLWLANKKDPAAIAAYLRARHAIRYNNLSKDEHAFIRKVVHAAYASDHPELEEIAKDIEKTLRFTEPRWLKLKKAFGLSARRAKAVDAAWKTYTSEHYRSGDQIMRFLSGELQIEYHNLYPEVPWIGFLDVGDPYEITLIYNGHTGRISFGTWGYYAERYGHEDAEI